MRSGAWGGTTAVVPGGLLDCAGAATTFAKAPKRIVTSNAAGLELLLRLGAGTG
ncbi:hypothetical protein M878_42310 [Streptomyces roseochromogenus subsp. oscitans DS 12.976]|uniref:Uncharacterized protein n=1 Tax=Streptomyces roseochromogenus subsp. oscitans DS 12.976 TaxID=1352936 RepID=V6JHU8_STRRC|nr:hypothetical protein M878_42310 [Streptomyces roseochromogenus subsp. oscitans DS 12.976]